MTPTEALRDIQGYASANRIRLTRHADQRRRERGAEYQDSGSR
jgi:hypothetical protein